MIERALVPPVDGRQSETALFVARGTRRLLRDLRFATVTELALPSGRRADIVALGEDGRLLIVEVKSSVADFRADSKWPDYRAHCDAFYFAISDAVPQEMIPEEAGLIFADSFGAAMIREAPAHPLPAATRKAMLLRFARAAADRLHALHDPMMRAEGL